MFDFIVRTIERLGYWGIAALTLLENVVPPIPSEVVVPLAGFVAAKGKLSFWGVVAAATIGALLGAIGWYGVARSIGKRRLRHWIDDHGHWVTLTRETIDKAQAWFDRHGTWAVFLGRLVPGVRTFVSVPAGFAEMGFLPFVLSSAAGTFIWTVALAWAGTVLESRFRMVGNSINQVSNVLLGLFLVYLAYRYVKVFRARR
jgi:membrane protein DedA with SNARE-associated domain